MKFSPTEVVSSQLETLGDARQANSRPSVLVGDVAVLYIAPVAAGVVLSLVRIDTPDVSSLLAAVAVFTGLIFNLAFTAFDRSLQIRRDPILSTDRSVIRLVDQLRANVNYTVLIGIILTAVLGSAALIRVASPPQWVTGLIGALLLHMLVMCLMVLKRFVALQNAMKP